MLQIFRIAATGITSVMMLYWAGVENSIINVVRFLKSWRMMSGLECAMDTAVRKSYFQKIWHI